MRWVRRVAVFALVLVVVLAGTLVYLIRRPFPQIQGVVTVPGLESEVEVIRDSRGVPHIYASSSDDLFLAQGYVHAQDRFWQMDFNRHVGAGRLSELFGASQLDTDRFLRTMGWSHTARQDLEDMGVEERQALEAYAAGVNAYLGERSGGALAFEYSLLALQNPGYDPEPWTPIDTLTWSRLMAWDLRSNLREELARTILSQRIPTERLEQLYPPYPSEHPLIVAGSVPSARAGTLPPETAPLLASLAERVAELDRITGGGLPQMGSNSWVVSGAHTASGAPLLANDPHLGIQMPSIWYEVGLFCRPVSDRCPYEVTGFSFAGSPGVILGHNRSIAWGVTNQGPDVMDLFIERIHPEDPDRYEVVGAWVEMEVSTELIQVAGGESMEIEVRRTRHGPVVSDVMSSLQDLEGNHALTVPNRYAVSLRWTALDRSSIVSAVLALNRASSWDEFRAALASWDIAAQNVVYADTEGNIGYQATGRIPVRATGDGRYPVPGWTGDHDWVGFIPTDELPSIFNPPSGMIVTANQPVIGADYPWLIGIDHAYGYRAKRITDLLQSAPRSLDRAVMTRIQLDSRDLSAEFLVPHLLAVEGDDSVRAMQTLLLRWSEEPEPFEMATDSAGAAAYAGVWRHLLAHTFDEELGPDSRAGGNGRFFEAVRRLLEAPDDAWWDVVHTDAVETRDDILRKSMVTAHAELSARLGRDESGWRWGDLHRARFASGTFGSSGIWPIEVLFNRSAPPRVSGGGAIVNATGWVAYEGYEVVALPSMRMVIDLADLTQSVAQNTTGQSGHPFHRHYADQIASWTDGQPHPMHWAADQVAADAEGRLRLVPAP